MAVTDWKAPGTAATVDRGEVEAAWSWTDNAKTDDENYARAAIGKERTSDWLRLTNFGFSIPADSSIDGIELQFKRAGERASKVRDDILKLRDSGGQVGDNKASATWWATSKETKTYGGAADTWNAGLSLSDINASTFGVDLAAFNTDTGNFNAAYIYFCQIRIHYTPPAVDGRKASFFKMF